MPDHVHAVVWFLEENQISIFMNKWKDVSSIRIAAAYQKHFPKYWATVDEKQHVWQRKYYGFNIQSHARIEEKVIYMHNNPVRAGLVKDPCDWPRSSARYWLLGKPVGISLSWLP